MQQSDDSSPTSCKLKHSWVAFLTKPSPASTPPQSSRLKQFQEATYKGILNVNFFVFAHLLYPEEASVVAESQEVRGTVVGGEVRPVNYQEVVTLAEDVFPLEEHPVVAVEADDTTLYQNEKQILKNCSKKK